MCARICLVYNLHPLDTASGWRDLCKRNHGDTHVHTHTHLLACCVGGGGEPPTAVSPLKRTISGTSSDALMSPSSIPEISVSSVDLASYVHQLRSHLPKASALIDGKPPDGGVAERARADMDREASSRSQSSESYAAEFMDRSITSRWDKQKPKVCVYVLELCVLFFPGRRKEMTVIDEQLS